jgi:hypothetical protein
MEGSLKQSTRTNGTGETTAKPRRNSCRRTLLDYRCSAVDHHHSIINRYNIINECLKLIRPSRIGTVEKLKMETMLIRVKILLLEEPASHLHRRHGSGDAAFEAVLEQVRKFAEEDCAAETSADLAAGIGALLTDFGSAPEAF